VSFKDTSFYKRLRYGKALAEWHSRKFDVPAPAVVKRSVLERWSLPNATWVETGTNMGNTTAFLARFAAKIITIEPEPNCFSAAVKRFQGNPDITVVNDVSENVLSELLAGLSGNVCFWLDGHYSGPGTFQGDSDCPVKDELQAISAHIEQWDAVSIMIDDMRCFDPQKRGFAHYPTRGYLVDWAVSHDLQWDIEHDIFIARSTKR
jgi:hypothetical protein